MDALVGFGKGFGMTMWRAAADNQVGCQRLVTRLFSTSIRNQGAPDYAVLLQLMTMVMINVTMSMKTATRAMVGILVLTTKATITATLMTLMVIMTMVKVKLIIMMLTAIILMGKPARHTYLLLHTRECSLCS